MCLLLLQARPIEEPVVQYGPFVMNTQKEIYEAYADYRKDQFCDCSHRRVGFDGTVTIPQDSHLNAALNSRMAPKSVYVKIPPFVWNQVFVDSSIFQSIR
ncbi:MAG: hypothetical protein CVU41_03005 [Chloroflexi bacterium HGW-Chloroflexi-3]|nr:MAG: hypothetical protein CVU41_03005 [Chloroflexi bacterium HGW-Chloroflexi-3]